MHGAVVTSVPLDITRLTDDLARSLTAADITGICVTVEPCGRSSVGRAQGPHVRDG
jgi:hypothetical protein